MYVARKDNKQNFNVNAAAAETKRPAAGSKLRVVQTSTDDVNRNWNAAGTEAEAAEPAPGPDDGESAAGDRGRKSTTMKVSIGPRSSRITERTDADSESEHETERTESQMARLRRLSSIVQEVPLELVEEKPAKARRSTKLRLCVRRCIAEDPTWDLKTVPDFDMLVVRHIADNYAGI